MNKYKTFIGDRIIEFEEYESSYKDYEIRILFFLEDKIYKLFINNIMEKKVFLSLEEAEQYAINHINNMYVPPGSDVAYD